MSQNLIEVNNLRKEFITSSSKVRALNNIDLEIHERETLGIVGVSGSGKSTLLHILGTLDHPTSGEVLYKEQDVFSKSENELNAFRNREIGFVFQFHYLLPEFSALENVMMPAFINGIDKGESRILSIEILNKVGLGNRLEHRPGELSGGEQQRVAIARAVVLKPKIILADEPTGNLDMETGQSILDLFLQLNDEYGIVVVVVTHNVDISKRLKRRITLSDGNIIDDN